LDGLENPAMAGPELKTVLPNPILFSDQRVNFSADLFAHFD
jgi:hypothetical protein